MSTEKFELGPVAGRAEAFDKLDDADKVRFATAENDQTLARLDELLTALDAIGAGVDDPDGLISVSLGHDGRLLEIRLAEGIGDVLTNIELEQRLAQLFAAGNQAVSEQRAEFARNLSLEP